MRDIMRDKKTQEIAEFKELAEGFREQSYLWRMISLIQTPVTVVAIVAALILYITADTIVQVDPKPSPGYYLTSQIPDKEFVLFALEFANLVSTYNSQTAERQFEHASKFLGGELYLDFREQYLNKANPVSNINDILRLDRTQAFFIDKFFIRIKRINNENPVNNQVEVRFYGVYTKFVKGSNKPDNREAALHITMQTVPNTVFNPNGIVITAFRFEEWENRNGMMREELEQKDKEESRKAQESKRKVNFVKFSW